MEISFGYIFKDSRYLTANPLFCIYVWIYRQILHYVITVPNLAYNLLPIEETLISRFIPAITRGYIFSDAEKR